MTVSIPILPLFLPLVMRFVVLASAHEQQLIAQCSCDRAGQCADLGFQKVADCKAECANWLAKYSADDKEGPMALMNCFGTGGGLNGPELTKCMRRKTGDYCAEDEDGLARKRLVQPDYAQWQESFGGNNSESAVGGSNFIRKARAAFHVFRNFQKCMNNCAKRHSTACFQSAGCAVSLADLDPETAHSHYNECTQQNAHRNARESCRCLIQKHKVYQLVGICSLFSNTILRMIL